MLPAVPHVPHAPRPAPPAPPASPTPSSPAGRLVYVDRLRVLAMAGVFVIHVAQPFNPFDQWHVTDVHRSRLVGEVVVLMAPWIMPLFMLLAGVGAWFALERRSNGDYLRERAVRLLVPLAVGMALLVPPQVWLERRLRGQFDGSLLEFYPHFLDGLYPRGNFSWHHLWFLALLFANAVVTLPLFRWWRSARGRAQLGRVARLCSGPGGLLWLSLPLVAERLLLSPWVSGDHALATDWSNRSLLLMAYVYGFVLAGEPWLGEDIDREWPRALAGALVGTALLVWATWTGVLPARAPRPWTPAWLLLWTAYAFGAWSWLVAIVGIARRALRAAHAGSPRWRRAGEVTAAWYLVHQPVIVAVAYVVVQWRAPVAAKVAAVLVASFALTLAIVEALRLVPVVRTVLGAFPPSRAAR